ncbi:MAG: hypothetical protein OMM_08743 [Candidatus Magnetoglobus multicellularis str. Araruama]|uniref:Carrier domain-containing protein n=1 Tax=Candidatus Magnetoglobus multicellularis str. Araruama TaxID=890399 RepID=A0A1V1P6N4_9BACT|nr:MAG: hypothetical protein OMM_08743 [Candidatus Magnetoglobus multicellularis str. Araruama]
MNNIENVIHEVVLKVAIEKELDVSVVQNNQNLIDDIGFKSIDMARIIAILESRLEADPFSELVPITSIQTVGDLCHAYKLCFSKDDQPMCQPNLEVSKNRAKMRLNSTAMRGERRNKLRS